MLCHLFLHLLHLLLLPRDLRYSYPLLSGRIDLGGVHCWTGTARAIEAEREIKEFGEMLEKLEEDWKELRRERK